MLKCALSKSPSIVRAAAYLDGMGVVVDDKITASTQQKRYACEETLGYI